MKKNIHPTYYEIVIKCSCGQEIKTGSTLKENFTLEVCNKCHPFFTGKQRKFIGGGRVDQFNKRFNIIANKK